VLDGGANNDVLTGGAAADTFNVTAGTDAITDLSVGGTADLLVVSSGAVANAKVAGAFTATSGTVNNGTANLTTETFLVSMAAATGSNGFTLIQAAKVLSSKVLVTNTALATITGSAAADTIYGAGAADSLVGGAGNDAIFGNEGADTITGGTGQDTMTGGAGADTFIFGATDSSVTAPDVIVGYTVLADKLDFAGTAVGVAADATVGTSIIASGLVKDTATGVNGVFATVAAGVTAAKAAISVDEKVAYFKVANDYYVFQEAAAGDVLVKLTGITSATTIGLSATDILIA
jgi:Ca2+-binding RTX toxin-like protein